MPHLFSPGGEAALVATLSRRPLLAFDFDGTLAPIVAQPADAQLSAGVAAHLAALARRLPLAIITGRSVEDVRSRLGFEPRFIVGNHGIEMDDLPEACADPGLLAGPRQQLQRHAAELAQAGVTVEDKRHSIALHYRLAPKRKGALRAIEAALDGLGPELRVFGGKSVVNLVPRRAPDKADAVRTLLARCGADRVLFAGDDVNDEPVFAAAEEGWLTVRIGREDRRSRAMYYLDSPTEMAMLLEKMVEMLEEPARG